MTGNAIFAVGEPIPTTGNAIFAVGQSFFHIRSECLFAKTELSFIIKGIEFGQVLIFPLLCSRKSVTT